MGIRERREREIADLRLRILEAAEGLFVREGYEQVSMRKIARKIEYSPTTIYRYFKNKAEIMEHLIAQGYQGVRDRYQVVLAQPSDTPLDTLARILNEYVDFALTHPEHYQLWFATGRLREEEGALWMSHGELSYRVYQVWMDLIDECREKGMVRGRDTLSLFQFIWGCVHGIVSLRLHHPHIRWHPPRNHVDELMSLLRTGIDS